MKSTALHRAICQRILGGILLVSATALVPPPTFAQHAAGGGMGHVGAARPGAAGPRVGTPGVGAPRVGTPGVRTPGVVGPGIVRPGELGPGELRVPFAPLTPLHNSVGRLGVFFPPVRRRNFPIFPIVGFPVFFGFNPFFGYNPFWFPSCNGFGGWGYGCGALWLDDSYAPGPVYSSNEYAPAGNFSADNLGPADNLGVESGVGEALPQTVLLYLKDGSVFAVTKYTVSDGKLHYTTSYGAQDDIDLDLLDLQKTIDQNAARGVTFTLTPPSSGTAAPSPNAPPPQ